MADFGLRTCPHCGNSYRKLLRGPMVFCSERCRFWSHVRIGADDECWEWTLSRRATGYGRFPKAKTDDGRRFHSAHRAAYYFANGCLPEEQQVLHRCDNPGCCNPGHLYLGGYVENNRDKRKRFRAGKKLSVAEARRIKADKREASVLAAEFGVSVSNIYFIRSGKIWADA